MLKKFQYKNICAPIYVLTSTIFKRLHVERRAFLLLSL